MAASPASSADGRNQNNNQEQITFRFCRECSNMLYPKEDLNNKKLMFACRTCQFSEEASSSCVFRNNLYNTVGETAGVTQDVGSDPTVGLPDFCTLCGQHIKCPFCKVAPSDSSSLCTISMEDFMDLDELAEEEGDEEGGFAAPQPIQIQLGTQHAQKSFGQNLADCGTLLAAKVEQAVSKLS